ncbi:MAG TPA: Hpt domain-containing protein [Candidatus Limnocylindrales bacterium]
MEREPPAVDRESLDELEHSVGDDRAFLRELVETYLDDAPRQIATIRSGIASGDVEATNRAAHTLKSTSASIGALGLSAMARELQTMTAVETTAASDLTEPDVTALVEVIATEYENVRSELESLVPADSDSS